MMVCVTKSYVDVGRHRPVAHIEYLASVQIDLTLYIRYSENSSLTLNIRGGF